MAAWPQEETLGAGLTLLIDSRSGDLPLCPLDVLVMIMELTQSRSHSGDH